MYRRGRVQTVMLIVKEVQSLEDCRAFVLERELLVLRQAEVMRQHCCIRISTRVEVDRGVKHTIQSLKAPRKPVALQSPMGLDQ